MTNSLFHDIHAGVDRLAASAGSVRVRDLVSIGQVMQHVVDSSAVPYVDPQGGGDPGMLGSFVPMAGGSTNAPEPDSYDEPEGGAWLLDKYGVSYWSPTGEAGSWVREGGDFVFVNEGSCTEGCITDEDADSYNPFLLCDLCLDALKAKGDVVEAVAARSPVACDIAADEEAEQDAALRSYLRSLNMGTWLTSQPNRFRYATPAYRGSSR